MTVDEDNALGRKIDRVPGGECAVGLAIDDEHATPLSSRNRSALVNELGTLRVVPLFVWQQPDHAIEGGDSKRISGGNREACQRDAKRFQEEEDGKAYDEHSNKEWQNPTKVPHGKV